MTINGHKQRQINIIGFSLNYLVPPTICSVTLSSVAQSRPTLCDSRDCGMPGLPVRHQLPELAPTHVHQVGDAIHLILLLLPSIFPSIRVFSNESALHFRWPMYYSVSFSISISPSNEYSGLISFRIDWFDLLEFLLYLLLSFLWQFLAVVRVRRLVYLVLG